MTTGDLWIRRYSPPPAEGVRLVCFPHAGGSASYFRPLALALRDYADVVAVQYPGRQDRWAEPMVEDLRVLARQVAVWLVAYADRPLALLGHSMGALVAYEVR